MRTVLIQPPLDDPTMPYHATAYLAGHLRAHGHSVVTRDLNVEFCDWSVQTETVEGLRVEAKRRLELLTRRASLGFAEQEEAYLLLRALNEEAGSALAAASALRSLDTFADLSLYRKQEEALKRHFTLLGALSFPAGTRDFGLRENSRFSLFHVDDLFDAQLVERAGAVVRMFLEQRVASDLDFVSADLFGISLTYDQVLLPGLLLARFLREAFPGRLVILGGTAISRYLKNLGPGSLGERILDLCDGVVMGEGETALLRIVESGGKPGAEVPNLLRRDATGVARWPTRVHFEDVRALSTPWFGLRWDLYFSPVRGICYSPTRGCYWNRCTFCDYGLNQDSPTSPWRVLDPIRAVADLEQIQKDTGAQYVYLAVDVLGAGYLERFSDAVLSRGLKIRWAAEMRAEKAFSDDRCGKLAASGLVAASFGVESGNQRILDLIDKGVKLPEVSAAMRSFAGAGIAVQPMWFYGFPTETPQERQDTFQFVREHEDVCSAHNFGHFVLTRGAIVAKDPSRFGIRTAAMEGLEASDEVAYEHLSSPNRSGDSTAVTAIQGIPDLPSVQRPWAGSVDSLHSLIAYDIHGTDAFKREARMRSAHGPARRTRDPNARVRLVGRLAVTTLDLGVMIENRLARLRHLQRLGERGLGATYTRYQEFGRTIPELMRSSHEAYWLLDEARVLRIDRETFDFLSVIRDTTVSWGHLLETGDASNSERLRTTMSRLHAWRFLSTDAEVGN